MFEHIYVLAAVAFIMGLGLGCGQPLSMMMVYNRSPKGRAGEALGVRMTVNKTAQFLVPILFGSIGTVFGFIPVFWVNAMLLFIGGFSSFEKNKDAYRNS